MTSVVSTPHGRTISLRQRQEELQRQQTERVAEERRQRAQELDDLARRAVTQMVSRSLRIKIFQEVSRRLQ